jgi:predicted nucleic acid-binding protein
LLAYPDLTPSEEIHIKAFLQDITIVDLNSTVKSHAINLRRRYRLKLPDALIGATALALDATLLTNGQRLVALAEIPTQTLQLKRVYKS